MSYLHSQILLGMPTVVGSLLTPNGWGDHLLDTLVIRYSDGRAKR
jgi:hypothetical protein